MLTTRSIKGPGRRWRRRQGAAVTHSRYRPDNSNPELFGLATTSFTLRWNIFIHQSINIWRTTTYLQLPSINGDGNLFSAKRLRRAWASCPAKAHTEEGQTGGSIARGVYIQQVANSFCVVTLQKISACFCTFLLPIRAPLVQTCSSNLYKSGRPSVRHLDHAPYSVGGKQYAIPYDSRDYISFGLHWALPSAC